VPIHGLGGYRSLRDALSLGVKHMPPAYFAMVMATGVMAIAAHAQERFILATALGSLNLAAFVVLWLLLAARLVRHPRLVFRDLIDHIRGPGYFTTIAATCMLGSQVLVLWNARTLALVLGVIGVVLWLLITYLVFTALTVKKVKPTLAEGLTGAWLIAVVATQSVAVLTASLAPGLPQPVRLELNFFALSMWLWGGMLYIWMISLIFYRYTFFPFSPEDLTPPYWINMGAMAISTLGGSLLILNADAFASPFLDSIVPFVKGFTVFFWATGTWWIPMLALLAIWRHGVARLPLRYDALYWGAVFPLGMYTLGTDRMIDALGLDFLAGVPRAFIVVALVAWIATFTGLVRSLTRAARQAWRGEVPSRS